MSGSLCQALIGRDRLADALRDAGALATSVLMAIGAGDLVCERGASGLRRELRNNAVLIP